MSFSPFAFSGFAICKTKENLKSSDEMSIDATSVLSKNIISFLTHVFKEENLDLEDEITSGSLYCHNGAITHEMTKDALEGENK